MRRIVILTQGKSNPEDAKTATGILRYRPSEVVALLDSDRVGEKAADLLGVGGDVPFISKLSDTDADTLLIGIAPAGGRLPEAWRAVVREAIERGMDVVSGLHVFLDEDPEFKELAARHGVTLHELRRPREGLTVSQDLARKTQCHRVHTIGHDCSVGKMVVAAETARALQEAGREAEFIATGQTGIMIAGNGVPIDRVISDFVAGAIEEEILARQDREFLVVEGQGSLAHPFYSGVTLGLLHGCAPQSLIMVFDPMRDTVRGTNLPMPPLAKLIDLYEGLASLLEPSRVVVLAANTSSLSANKAERLMRQIEEETGRVTTDIIRQGPQRVVDALLVRHAELGLDAKGSRRKKGSQ